MQRYFCEAVVRVTQIRFSKTIFIYLLDFAFKSTDGKQWLFLNLMNTNSSTLNETKLAFLINVHIYKYQRGPLLAECLPGRER